MHSYKDCQEYIKYRKPFQIFKGKFDRYDVYEYDANSDLVYDTIEKDFFFVSKADRGIKSPLSRSFHRLDGPGHITPRSVHWYYHDTMYQFSDWFDLTELESEQEKVKLRLMYAI